MYHVSEQLILESWSLETLVIKVRHGFSFELAKRGIVIEKESDSSNGDDIALMNLYN